MTVAYIDDHIAQAEARLISQYQGKPRILAVIDALASRTQVVEDAIAGVVQDRLLANAQGAQLDAIGELVGQNRNGQPDAIYRLLLLGAIQKNVSRGTLADALNVAKTLFGASQVMAVHPNSFGQDRNVATAELTLFVGSPTTDLSLLPIIIKIIKLCLPQGVALLAILSFDAGKAMATDGPQPWVGGFGGPLGGLLYNAAS